MAFDDSFLQELRSRADIESTISPYVTLKRRGRLLTGLCPFHNEKTPSFTVYPETQSYYCFGCGSGGDAVTFIKNIENLDYVEAVRYLADKVGLAVPQDGFNSDLYEKRRRMYEANRLAARFFYTALYSESGAAGLTYLHNRGLTDATIRKFGLGYAPKSWDALRNYMHGQGFTDLELYEANLLRLSEKNGKKHYYDAFVERVMFPVMDLRGNVLAFSGRAVTADAQRKYVNTSDTLIYKKGENIFALNFAKKSNQESLILCEGNMDVISLHQAGFDNAVAGLGTALTDQQAALLARYASEIYLCYDNDEAGQKAARKALALFSKTTLRVKVIRMQGGKDPDEIIKTYGAARFKDLLEGAANDVEYRILRARDGLDITTSDGKSRFLEVVCTVLATLKNPTQLDIYASRLSEELGVAKDAIILQTKQQHQRNTKRQENDILRTAREQERSAEKQLREANPEREKHLRAAKAEETLCASFMHNPEFYKILQAEISPADFVTDFNRRVFESVLESARNGAEFSVSAFGTTFTDAELGAVARIQTLIPQLANTLSECRDCIKVIAEEKNKVVCASPAELSDADFLKLFQNT